MERQMDTLKVYKHHQHARVQKEVGQTVCRVEFSDSEPDEYFPRLNLFGVFIFER